MPFSNPVVGGTTLVRPAIKSPNYVTGASGWSINQDGTAEFNGLTIRSSNGTNSTITEANGVITITNAQGVTVATISASGGLTLFDASGNTLAQVNPTGGQWGSGFWTRGFQAPENIYSLLSGGQLQFGTTDSTIVKRAATIQWVNDDTVHGCEMLFDTGAYGATGTQGGLTINSPDDTHPRARVTFTDSVGGAEDVIIPGQIKSSVTQAWQNLTLASGISAHTSLTPAVWVDPTGKALLRGSLQSSGSISAGAVLATLPAGTAPANSDYYPTLCNVGSGNALAYLNIQTNGQIVYSGPTGTVSYLFLGGVVFPQAM